MRQKPELLAPAGDLEKLKIAFQYGADAVYASTPQFSMRTREIGFDYVSLKEGIDFAHAINKKVYITLNIYPHPLEIDDLKKHIDKLIQLMPDALITADPGIIEYVKSKTDIPLHLSTQANATNQLAINFWAKQGVERVVLARELSIEEIKEISKNIGILPPPPTPPRAGGEPNTAPPFQGGDRGGYKQVELEAFVHGSMCMAYSGRCQISNYLAGRDPNRGACVQACRFNYRLNTKSLQECHCEKPDKSGDEAIQCNDRLLRKNTRNDAQNNEYALEEEFKPGEYFPILEDARGTHILNSRDLCVVGHIPELIEAGISSLKIEGRLKGIYYVGAITRLYREAIDLYCSDPNAYEKAKPYLILEAQKIASRRYTTGFYFSKPNEETNNYESSKPTSDWSYAGLVTGYDKKKKMVEFLGMNQVIPGRPTELVSPHGIVPIDCRKLYQDGVDLPVAHAGYAFQIPYEKLVENNVFLRQKIN